MYKTKTKISSLFIPQCTSHPTPHFAKPIALSSLVRTWSEPLKAVMMRSGTPCADSRTVAAKLQSFNTWLGRHPKTRVNKGGKRWNACDSEADSWTNAMTSKTGLTAHSSPTLYTINHVNYWNIMKNKYFNKKRFHQGPIMQFSCIYQCFFLPGNEWNEKGCCLQGVENSEDLTDLKVRSRSKVKRAQTTTQQS